MRTRLRRVLREFTDFPATTTIGALWIAAYVAMAWYQGTPHAGADWLRGGIQPATSHVFGDLTSWALYGGQVWRVVTATFVHYSLLHLGLNLLSLYQLGRVVEDWYGSGRFVALYVVLGGLGNALAGLARPWLPAIVGDPWDTPSGGGSTAIFGLLTLIGVGAWRSRTRFGDYAKGVVLCLLVLNGIIAYLLRKYMDHYGHAGGALVGAVVGLGHHALSRDPEGPASRRTGLVGAAVLVACAAGQVWADLSEARLRRAFVERVRVEQQARAEVDRRLRALGDLQFLRLALEVRSRRGPGPVLSAPSARGPRGNPGTTAGAAALEGLSSGQLRGLIRTALANLDAHQGGLDSGPTAAPYRRLRALAGRAVDRAPTPGEFRAFEDAWAPVARRAEADAGAAVAALKALAPRPAPAWPG